MDTSSPNSRGTPKRHSRHGSSNRALPRRSTRGPLDVSDPASNPLSSPTALAHQTSSRMSPTPSRYHTPRLPSPTPGSNLSSSSIPSFKTAHSTLPATQKDFSYLLRPEIYHPLTLIDVPPPFRQPNTQPSTNTPLPNLISSGHFRSAAISAAQALTSPSTSPSDHHTIFALIYIRLSSLTLCNQTALAAQEVKSLEDLNSSYYRDDESDAPLIPWHLRVLAVRLQGMGYADARRAVMGYYDLAREARLTLTTLKKSLTEAAAAASEEHSAFQTEISTWTTRLRDLGIRVASALIEMEDLEGASRFLNTLQQPSSPHTTDLEMQKALLYLCLGDVEAAHGCVISSKDGNKVIKALAHMADAAYGLSAPAWEDLIASSTADGDGDGDGDGEVAMYKQNLAVCYLYLGRMDDARHVLESLLAPTSSDITAATNHALTFNLSTIYELCTERSRALKVNLAEKVAEILIAEREAGGGGLGGEKVNGDFKL